MICIHCNTESIYMPTSKDAAADSSPLTSCKGEKDVVCCSHCMPSFLPREGRFVPALTSSHCLPQLILFGNCLKKQRQRWSLVFERAMAHVLGPDISASHGSHLALNDFSCPLFFSLFSSLAFSSTTLTEPGVSRIADLAE